jgi:hypothetical protein
MVFSPDLRRSGGHFFSPHSTPSQILFIEGDYLLGNP